MIRQIRINDKWSYDDYGMYISEAPTIEFPELQSYKINVPFRNGSIDMTDFLGRPTFKNRKIVIKFFFRDRKKLMRFADDVHGHKCKISIHPPYYFLGRISLGDFSWSENDEIQRGTIIADCTPFKYLDELRGFNLKNLKEGKWIKLVNNGYPTVATFKGNATIEMNHKEFIIIGESKIELPHGEIIIKIKTNTTSLSCDFKEMFVW